MKDILTSPRAKDLKRKRHLRRVRLSILFFILAIVIITALAYFSGNPKVSIQYVTVTGTSIISPEEVQAKVEGDIQGKYIKLFARSNSFIYPKSFIYRDLIATFPRISTLSIYRDNFKTLHISITERAGSSLYCGSTVPTLPADIGENCYFVNNDGYIFDKAPYFSGNVYFKYYVTIPGDQTAPLGSSMLPADQFHSLVRFIDSITKLGFKPIYIVMGADGNNSLYLNPASGSLAPVIMFKSDNNLDTILSNLALAMSKPEFANEIKDKYATLLYIDLRFDNKVLYKFQ